MLKHIELFGMIWDLAVRIVILRGAFTGSLENGVEKLGHWPLRDGPKDHGCRPQETGRG